MNLEFRTLYANEIETRVAQATEKGVSILLYKDARVDQKLLDEKVGPYNWQRHHSRDNANCTVAIWDEDKKQWIEKEDTGTESNTEAAKGLASDSFKRACFNWGIGRELYTAPRIWLGPDVVKVEQRNGKWTTYDRFEVSQISYDTDRNIKHLILRNAKTKKVVYTFGNVAESSQKQPAEPQTEAEAEETAKQVGKQTIDATKVTALAKAAQNNGVPLEKILKAYKVKAISELTEKQFANINQHWEDLKRM